MQSHPLIISPESLPLGSNVTFQDSSFFSRNGPNAVLPSPSQVLAKRAEEDSRFEHRSDRPVFYGSLGLVVKLGQDPRVTVAEGQCLWALRRYSPQVPVPEIYGWAIEGKWVFLYMQLIKGTTLEKRWESLSRIERTGICEQLRLMLAELRQLRQDPNDRFLGHINRDPYGDIVFTNGVLPRAGPFRSVPEFHDYLSYMTKIGKEIHWPGYKTEEIPDPYRQLLPDDSTVVFTHADLHPSNIMVTEQGSPCRIVALIDWQQSGWYPDYWEFCKAEFTVDPKSEWCAEYIPSFLEQPSDTCLEGFESYARTYGY